MNNEINIEEIMEEIRQNIKDRGYDKEPLSFEDVQVSSPAIAAGDGYNASRLMYELDYMNHNWNNNFQVPVTGRNFLVVFVKKAIRKFTRFIVFPIVNFQNSYNGSNVRCLNQIKEYMAEIDVYKQRIEQLEKEIEHIKNNSVEGMK